MNEPEPAPVQAHMTTSYRNICSLCAVWYTEPGPGEFCFACMRKEFEGADEEAEEAAIEIEDLNQRIIEIEDDLAEQKTEANELVRERIQLQADLDDLRAQLEKARAPEIVTVKLGAGIVEALHLDDAGVRSMLGIDWEAVGKGRKHIRVRGTRSALGKLLCRCRSRCDADRDQPAHYKRSARAAIERLEAVL